MAQQTTEISDSLAPVLSYCEQQRFTGRLEVQTREGTAQIMLLSGIVESTSLGAETGDEVMSQLSALPIEALTSEVLLPPVNARTTRGLLPRGALGMLRPVELMRFCEKNALTCTLSIQAAGTSLRIEYERGELTELTPESAMTPAVLEACDGQYKFDLPQLSTLSQFVSKEKGGAVAKTAGVAAPGNRPTAGQGSHSVAQTPSNAVLAAKSPSPVRPAAAGMSSPAQRAPGARRMAPEAIRMQPPRAPVVVKQATDNPLPGAISSTLPLPTRSNSQPPAAQASAAVTRPAAAAKKTAALGSMAVAPTAAAIPKAPEARGPAVTADRDAATLSPSRPRAAQQAPAAVAKTPATSPMATPRAAEPAAKAQAAEPLGAAPSLTVQPVTPGLDAPNPMGSLAPPPNAAELSPLGSADPLKAPDISLEPSTPESPKRLYPRIYLAFVLLLAAAGWTMWELFR